MNAGRSANPFGVYDWPGTSGQRRGGRRGRSSSMEPADPTELMRQMTEAYGAIYGPLLENLTRYWGGSTANPWMGAMTALWPGQQETTTRRRGRSRGRERDCGCDEGDCDGCGRDDCHCECCVVDADLVVHARLGETRIVPLTIENPRRRQREVRLELSNWTTRRGAPASIQGIILPPTEFTLEPCSEREVVLAIQVQFGGTGRVSAALQGVREAGAAQPAHPGQTAREGQNAQGAQSTEGGQTAQSNQTAEREAGNAESTLASLAARAANLDASDRRLADVDQCEVYYADLRVEGCDMRPVRLAVAVLPRDCESHPINCGCGCCR
jgi:hypothetical protein